MCCKFPRGKFHTHAAKIKPQPNACSSCFKQHIPFLLRGENMYNYFIASIASSRCLEDTPGDTFVHTLAREKYSPAGSLENSDSKSKTILCLPWIASRRLVYCSSIQCPICECIWLCNVTPDLYRETVTQHTLSWPNGFARMAFKSSSVINLVYSYKATQEGYECRVLFL